MNGGRIRTSAGEVNRKAIGMVGRVSGKRILDAGAGSGEIARYFFEGNDVMALDNEIKLDKDLLDKISFLKADLSRELKLKDESYDFIFCIEVLDALENYRNALREFRRCLKKDGKLIVSFCNIHCFKSRINLLLNGKLFGYKLRDYHLAGHRQPIPVDIFQEICKEEGLRVLEKKYCNNGEIVLFKIGKRELK